MSRFFRPPDDFEILGDVAIRVVASLQRGHYLVTIFDMPTGDRITLHTTQLIDIIEALNARSVPTSQG